LDFGTGIEIEVDGADEVVLENGEGGAGVVLGGELAELGVPLDGDGRLPPVNLRSVLPAYVRVDQLDIGFARVNSVGEGGARVRF